MGMQIEHIAVWTKNLEMLKEFYVQYFGARAGSKYINAKRGFESYFLQFETGGRIEIMSLPDLNQVENSNTHPSVGYAHIAFSVGSKEMVDELTTRLREAGFELLSGPRTTGDGYYESVILDPDGNQVEITL
jgi:lactoylglutathione lyase